MTNEQLTGRIETHLEPSNTQISKETKLIQLLVIQQMTDNSGTDFSSATNSIAGSLTNDCVSIC